MQRSEQTYTLFCDNSACSAVDEANFQDRRIRKDLRGLTIVVEEHKGRRPSEGEANELECEISTVNFDESPRQFLLSFRRTAAFSQNFCVCSKNW